MLRYSTSSIPNPTNNAVPTTSIFEFKTILGKEKVVSKIVSS